MRRDDEISAGDVLALAESLKHNAESICKIQYKLLSKGSSACLSMSNTHVSVKGKVKIKIKMPYMLLSQHLNGKFIKTCSFCAMTDSFEYVIETVPANACYAIPIVRTCSNALISEYDD